MPTDRTGGGGVFVCSLFVAKCLMFYCLKGAANGDGALSAVAALAVVVGLVGLAVGNAEADVCLQRCAGKAERILHSAADVVLCRRQKLVFAVEEGGLGVG